MLRTRTVVASVLIATFVVVGLLVLKASSGGTVYKLRFQTAGQLVKGDEVQVGGRGIGSIKQIELTKDNQAEITIEINDEFAPLHEGSTAVIRATSLSGVANRYIALTPGPNSKPKLPSKAVIPTEKTTTAVDLDQLFNTLDPAARKDLKNLIRGSDTAFAGKGKQANDSFKYLNPAVSTTDRVIRDLKRDQDAFTGLIVNSAQLVSTLDSRRAELQSLISNLDTTSGAIAKQNTALANSLELLPHTVRQANSTFVDLRLALDDLDKLVAAAKPATKDLAPFLADLTPLLTEAKPTVASLNTALNRSGSNNDLIDIAKQLPTVQKVASPALKNTNSALKSSQEIIEFGRPYTPELTGWLRDFGQITGYYDANGHYARVSPTVNPFSFTDNSSGGLLTPREFADRYKDFQTGQTKNCPGTASQPAQDGSTPFTDGGALGSDDCNSSIFPEGF